METEKELYELAQKGYDNFAKYYEIIDSYISHTYGQELVETEKYRMTSKLCLMIIISSMVTRYSHDNSQLGKPIKLEVKTIEDNYDLNIRQQRVGFEVLIDSQIITEPNANEFLVNWTFLEDFLPKTYEILEEEPEPEPEPEPIVVEEAPLPKKSAEQEELERSVAAAVRKQRDAYFEVEKLKRENKVLTDEIDKVKEEKTKLVKENEEIETLTSRVDSKEDEIITLCDVIDKNVEEINNLNDTIVRLHKHVKNRVGNFKSKPTQ